MTEWSLLWVCTPKVAYLLPEEATERQGRRSQLYGTQDCTQSSDGGAFVLVHLLLQKSFFRGREWLSRTSTDLMDSSTCYRWRKSSLCQNVYFLFDQTSDWCLPQICSSYPNLSWKSSQLLLKYSPWDSWARSQSWTERQLHWRHALLGIKAATHHLQQAVQPIEGSFQVTLSKDVKENSSRTKSASRSSIIYRELALSSLNHQ